MTEEIKEQPKGTILYIKFDKYTQKAKVIRQDGNHAWIQFFGSTKVKKEVDGKTKTARIDFKLPVGMTFKLQDKEYICDMVNMKNPKICRVKPVEYTEQDEAR